MAEVVPIPSPAGYPIIGNLTELTGHFMKDVERLSNTWGEIFRLSLGGGRTVVFVANNKLVNEICDEKRFHKTLNSVISQVRNGVHDGLFTASEDEPNWGKAHRILIPAFGPMPIRGMFDEMHDIASQLALKFARHGPHAPIQVSDDFTRLALDTLALCAMNFRFNSFYHEELHPFITAMGDFLKESGNRRRRMGPSFMYRKADEKYWNDIAILRKTADEVVANRKANPGDRKDLLSSMLEGVDSRTGEKLDDKNITDQLITFLIAGHETTSGLLSFSFYHLLKNPEAYHKVQQEVDEVIGKGPIRVEHLTKLPYITGVLRETLRVNSSIPAFSVEPYEDTLLDGKYLVKRGEVISAVVARSHFDPVVYGDDARDFKPERMMDGNFAKLNEEFPNCWKPFGNGKRACIGRPFAWQEAILCMAMLFQNFNFTMDDPNYNLDIMETLTIKPKGFYMHATLRDGMAPTDLEPRLAGQSHPEHAHSAKKHEAAAPTSGTAGKPLAVYYGSQSGTCEAMAQRVAADAPSHGFAASTVAPLDEANENLPKDRPIVIITASYEGQPPSNAGLFVNWIENLKAKELEGANFAVYGCGHHDWIQTFHRIPKLVDATLEQRGASRLAPLSCTDAADRDMFSDFETWEDDVLWPALKEKYGSADTADTGRSSAGFSVEISSPRKSTLRQDVEEAIVVSEKTLTKSGGLKKHIDIKLPTGMVYRSGDYLAILPMNPENILKRVFRRFELAWDATLTITSDRPTTLPLNTQMSARDILGAYVELSQPATKRNVSSLIDATDDQAVVEQLRKLAGDDYHEQISQKRVSILDLLEKFPSIQLPIGAYLSMLPPMRVRQYSISSSPLADATTATLTYSVLNEPSMSGDGHQHVGVASNYLSNLAAGDKLHVAVRPSNSAFRLPSDSANTPIICIAAGSGLAPFRGFIQERAAMISAGRKLAPALLFFGCRSPDQDDLYADELASWEALGAVEVRRAYSRDADKSCGCKYVQHRIDHDRADVIKLWDSGAMVYVCGSREVGKAVEETFVKMAMGSKTEKHPDGLNEDEARSWFENLRNERYATDVFD